MSLQGTQTTVKQFPVGIISAKNLDDPSFLDETIGENVVKINHIYTNNANKLVLDYGMSHGIPVTVYPISGEKNLLWSISRVVENSKFVYIVATPDSGTAKHGEATCKSKNIKFRVCSYDPVDHWRKVVCQVAEVVAASTNEDMKNNEFLKAVAKLV